MVIVSTRYSYSSHPHKKARHSQHRPSVLSTSRSFERQPLQALNSLHPNNTPSDRPPIDATAQRRNSREKGIGAPARSPAGRIRLNAGLRSSGCKTRHCAGQSLWRLSEWTRISGIDINCAGGWRASGQSHLVGAYRGGGCWPLSTTRGSRRR